MAHKKGAGSTKNRRDSKSKHLGKKVCPEQHINKPFVRQAKLSFGLGKNVLIGKDYSFLSSKEGFGSFENYNNEDMTNIDTYAGIVHVKDVQNF